MKTVPTTRDELDEWGYDHYDTVKVVAEGTPEEALMAGWIYALDTEYQRGEELSDEEFIQISFEEYDRMGYPR